MCIHQPNQLHVPNHFLTFGKMSFYKIYFTPLLHHICAECAVYRTRIPPDPALQILYKIWIAPSQKLKIVTIEKIRTKYLYTYGRLFATSRYVHVVATPFC